MYWMFYFSLNFSYMFFRGCCLCTRQPLRYLVCISQFTHISYYLGTKSLATYALWYFSVDSLLTFECIRYLILGLLVVLYIIFGVLVGSYLKASNVIGFRERTPCHMSITKTLNTTQLLNTI